jgi:hypothetical protein
MLFILIDNANVGRRTAKPHWRYWRRSSADWGDYRRCRWEQEQSLLLTHDTNTLTNKCESWSGNFSCYNKQRHGSACRRALSTYFAVLQATVDKKQGMYTDIFKMSFLVKQTVPTLELSKQPSWSWGVANLEMLLIQEIHTFMSFIARSVIHCGMAAIFVLKTSYIKQAHTTWDHDSARRSAAFVSFIMNKVNNNCEYYLSEFIAISNIIFRVNNNYEYSLQSQ